jgi:hypothetical protein
MRTALITGGLLLVAGLFIGCERRGDDSSAERPYAYLIEPYGERRLEIFHSEGRSDTMIFYPVREEVEQVRHLERGFYDERHYRVDHELTPGSYHRLSSNSDGTRRKRFIGITEKSGRKGASVELYFLGSIFDKDGLPLDLEAESVVLSDSTALYSGININEGIRSFTFDRTLGVVEFVDLNGHHWKRQ